MRPANDLIIAWKTMLEAKRQARVCLSKAALMFKHSANDAVFYNRANELHREGTSLNWRAEVAFRKVLKSHYATRYELQWINDTTAQVWVRAAYNKAHPVLLKFNKSLRVHNSNSS